MEILILLFLIVSMIVAIFSLITIISIVLKWGDNPEPPTKRTRSKNYSKIKLFYQLADYWLAHHSTKQYNRLVGKYAQLYGINMEEEK